MTQSSFSFPTFPLLFVTSFGGKSPTVITPWAFTLVMPTFMNVSYVNISCHYYLWWWFFILWWLMFKVHVTCIYLNNIDCLIHKEFTIMFYHTNQILRVSNLCITELVHGFFGQIQLLWWIWCEKSATYKRNSLYLFLLISVDGKRNGGILGHCYFVLSLTMPSPQWVLLMEENKSVNIIALTFKSEWKEKNQLEKLIIFMGQKV